VSAAPAQPKIYHITHVDNLRDILADDALLSDRCLLDRGGPGSPIGMSSIKRRRLERLEVKCHPGTMVGDYVPFYFCPRSVMLFVISRGNHPELAYRGGQRPIVHLEADLREVVRWAQTCGSRWAFSLSNAGAAYAQFRSKLEDLDHLDWGAIAATDFRAADVKEGKQAEFLVYERFPVELVTRIGVQSPAIRSQVVATFANAPKQPVVEVRPDWYF